MVRTTPSPRSPIRLPLIAGAGTAITCAALVGVIALLGPGEAPSIGVRASLPEVRPEVHASADSHDGEAGETIIFAEGGSADDVTLPGLEADTDAVLNPPAGLQAALNAPRAPLPGLSETGPGGPLPIISASGQRPDEAYAQSFDGDPSVPTIALVVGGLGLNRALTLEAIEQLPAEVTLSFVPYSRDLQGWIDRARADGHEVLIELPMEPFDYPNNDPGPHTLLAEATPAENQRRLEWLLSRAAGYTGVINYLGARLGANSEAMEAIFRQLEARGITVFHDGSGRRSVLSTAQEVTGARLALVDRLLDANPTSAAIDARLLDLEALALQNGSALGLGSPFPTTVESLADWAAGLPARGYQLAPASFVSRMRNTGDESAT